MRRTAGVLAIGIVVLAMVVAGCKTTPPKGRGKLCIDVYAKGARDALAEVFIDGNREFSVSMAKREKFFLFLPAGERIIKVEAEGFETVEKTIKIKRGETTWTDIRMKRPEPEEAEAAEEPAAKPADK